MGRSLVGDVGISPSWRTQRCQTGEPQGPRDRRGAWVVTAGPPRARQWPGTHAPASCKAGPVRSRRLASPPTLGGLDGAQAHLDMARRPAGTRGTVAHEDAGLA